MKPLIHALVLLLTLLLNGCASKPSQSDNTMAWLTPQVAVQLPMIKVTEQVNYQQLLTSQIKGKQHNLIALLTLNPGSINLTGLSPMGIRLFSLDYDGQHIEVEQYLLLPELPSPNQVLADIMLSYAPLSEWQKVLPSGWRLIETNNQRYLLDQHGAVISEITYQIIGQTKQPILLQHHCFLYQISIQNMDNPL